MSLTGMVEDVVDLLEADVVDVEMP